MGKQKKADTTAEKPVAKDMENVSYIHESLRALAVPLDGLHPDPANARTHDAKNIAAIRGSLVQFGQRRPAVVQKQGMIVRAGNGMLQAARELGWTHLAAIIVDENDVAATAFGIADNRTAELADWDEAALIKSLAALQDVEFTVNEDLEQMLLEIPVELDSPEEEQSGDAEAEPDQPLPDEYHVLVQCTDEADQVAFIEECQKKGRECRAYSL